MTARVPQRINVHDARDHVEVVGLNREEVEYAIALYQAVNQEKVESRAVLASYVNRVMLKECLDLISTAPHRQVRRSAILRKDLIAEQ